MVGHEILDIFMHLESQVDTFNDAYGLWVYALMFVVFFAETGFIVTAFLPSDTVLFTVGALAAKGADFNLWLTLGLMALATFLGDTLNFACGRYLGAHFFATRTIPFFSQQDMAKAHAFYKEHGGVAIVAARFVPVLRSFAPLAGGISGMEWPEFLKYNAIGKLIWTPLYLFGGYFFGQTPWVQRNFSWAIFLALGAPLLGVTVRYLYLIFAPKR